MPHADERRESPVPTRERPHVPGGPPRSTYRGNRPRDTCRENRPHGTFRADQIARTGRRDQTSPMTPSRGGA